MKTFFFYWAYNGNTIEIGELTDHCGVQWQKGEDNGVDTDVDDGQEGEEKSYDHSGRWHRHPG